MLAHLNVLLGTERQHLAAASPKQVSGEGLPWAVRFTWVLAVADEREVLRIAQCLLHAGKKEHDDESRSLEG